MTIIGRPDLYPGPRRSVYELKFTRGKPKVLEHHRLRAGMYKWLSEAEHAYLLYCSPRGFREFEVNDEFHDEHVRALIENWVSPMWVRSASYAHMVIYAPTRNVDLKFLRLFL